jgi:hypothetical protein
MYNFMIFVLLLDPGSGMDKNQDPGSGINIPDPQHYSSLLFSAFPDPLSVLYLVSCVSVHGPENAVDGDISTYWQSPPISRGRKYNRVDLEINLLQDFIVRIELFFLLLTT